MTLAFGLVIQIDELPLSSLFLINLLIGQTCSSVVELLSTASTAIRKVGFFGKSSFSVGL
jgi:hypothetical protein